MSEKIPVRTIAFEGLHRSGKGTQLEVLKDRIEKLNIPCIIIRGAGSRQNSDKSAADKYSIWWEEHLAKLSGPSSTKMDWVEGSRRLAREVIVFRDRLLPELARKEGSKEAVLLIDRSVLSHLAMLDGDELSQINTSAVYGKHDERMRKVPSTADVFPDVVFYLKAEPADLYSRLNADDPKYEFRKKNIEESAGAFDRAIAILPSELRERVIEIDASRSTEEVSAEVFEKLSEKIRLPDNT